MSKLSIQLKLTINKSNAPEVGSDYKSHPLKILGKNPSLTLETMLENGKLFSVTSPALVCDNTDNEINIRLAMLKQLNVNMSFD